MIVFSLTTGHKLGLGLIVIAFIAFAILSSMVLPRRLPGFPGRQLGPFLLACVAFFGATVFAIAYFGHESEAEGGLGVTAASAPTETGKTPQEGESPPATTTGAASAATLAAGKKVFTTAGCSGCHTLADASASGTVGPNLDQLKPAEAVVAKQVENGGAIMPAFKGKLSAEQIQAVAQYVSSVAGTS